MTDQALAIVPAQEDELDKIPADELADVIIPNMVDAIEQAESIEEVNEIRVQIETVSTYVNRRLQIEVNDKKAATKKANKFNKAYLEACRKAGGFWLAAEKYEGRPPEDRQKASSFVRFLTAEEAGFPSRQDAHRCAKIAQLDEEDWRTYFQEKDNDGGQYTLGGLVHAYDLLNPKVDEEEGEIVKFTTRSIRKRFRSYAKGILEALPVLEGDIADLAQTALDSLMDIEEIYKASEDDG